jgi:proteasome accessory factor A
MRRIVEEEAIKHAIFQPPETTRAFFRGRSVARFNSEITSIQWDELAFANNGSVHVIELNHPALDAELERKNQAIREALSIEDLVERIG